MTTNTLHLPYEFDTRRHGRTLLHILLLADFGCILAIAAILYFTQDPTLRLWLPPAIGVFAMMQIVAGLVVFRAAGGAYGTVGKVHVTIEPDKMLGLTSRSHRGTFPLTDFAGFELRRIGAGGRVGILSIIGKNPQLRITLTATPYENAKAEADFLSKELHLPLQEAKP
jgi:hypothetical protein